MTDAFKEYWDKKYDSFQKIERLFMENGFQIGKPFFQLTLEDMIWVMADMDLEGKLDFEALKNGDFMLVLQTVEDELQESIDWYPFMQQAIYAAKYETRGVKGDDSSSAGTETEPGCSETG